jgi:hypothetical protein
MCRSYGTLENGLFFTRGLKSTATILTVSTRLLHPQNLWVMDRVCNLTQVIMKKSKQNLASNLLNTYYTIPLRVFRTFFRIITQFKHENGLS